MKTAAARTENVQGALIALDWGTTNVRAALLGSDGAVIAERHGESGVGRFSIADFESRFDALLLGWPAAPAIAAGMVGSRQGWQEAAYLACPTGVDSLATALTRFDHSGRSIAIVPGLKMEGEQRFDVMRGEETQIAGLLALQPGFSGTLVLPGSHSKWVQVRDGLIVKFTTYMTGEMFAALAGHTILRHSVALPETHGNEEESTIDRTEFSSAVVETLTGRGSDLARLFDLRARSLLGGAQNSAMRARLSGLLIGMELQAAAQDGYDVEDVTIIGSGNLVSRYQSAGESLGARMKTFEGSSLIWPALFDLALRANILGENHAEA